MSGPATSSMMSRWTAIIPMCTRVAALVMIMMLVKQHLLLLAECNCTLWQEAVPIRRLKYAIRFVQIRDTSTAGDSTATTRCAGTVSGGTAEKERKLYINQRKLITLLLQCEFHLKMLRLLAKLTWTLTRISLLQFRCEASDLISG